VSRIDVYKAWPDGYAAMQQLEAAVRASGLEHSLLELVKTRVSQINGCAFCIDMHTKDARAAGETEQRLYGLSAWRETPYYSDRERAALDVAEHMTTLDHERLDVALESATSHFDGAELAKLTYAVVAINSWNRLAIAAAGKVGGYVAGSL
jgi:AhpD family alkylhydroperoxidase